MILLRKMVSTALLCFLIALSSTCFASAWQLAARDDGAHEDYYLLSDSIWFDGTLGGAGMKIRYPSGAYDLLEFQFLVRSGDIYRVSFKNIAAHNAKDEFMYYVDNDCHFTTGKDAPLARVCKFAIRQAQMKEVGASETL